MRFLRGLLGALLWILGTVLGLVAIILCVTVILLPLGIPLFKLSRRLVGKAVLLMLPRPLADPAGALKRGSKRARKKGGKQVDSTGKKVRKKAKNLTP